MNTYTKFASLHKLVTLLVFTLSVNWTLSQSAVVSNTMAIGKNCGRNDGENFKVFDYNKLTSTLTQRGANCFPSLGTQAFTSGGGSIAFRPTDQKLYYIATTTGNNSIVWSWTPGTCPTNSQLPLYTYNNAFIVGLDFNPITGEGYQVEFVGAQAPYSIYLRKVTDFGPPLVAGVPQQIVLPAGINIYQQNGDIVITPTGQMYFVFNNKMFSLDYSNYGNGTLNANYIDTIRLAAGVNMVGLSYNNGKFIGSATNNGTTCIYREIDISTSPITLKNIISPIGSSGTRTFTTLDMASLITGIGVAKKISGVSPLGNNKWSVQYDVKVRGYGNTNLSNVQVVDNLATVFGSSFVSASLSSVGSLPLGLTLNPSYNGNSNSNIFIGGASSTLRVAPADSAIIRITVILDNPNINTTYYSSSTATAQNSLFSQTVSDASNDDMALHADPNNNDVPDDTNENIPTPLKLSTWAVLPNKILDFNAISDNNKVKITWRMENVTEESKVNIQHSKNGNDFISIGSMSAIVSIRKDYKWIDENPNSNENFYRLELVNKDNKVYSNVVKASGEKQTLFQIQTFPNPFSQYLNVKIYLPTNQIIKYRLLDLNTRVITNGERFGLKGENLFNINGLHAIKDGPYIIEIKTKDHLFTKAIFKLIYF